MNIQIQMQVCRACLKPSDATKLTEYSADSEILKSYLFLLALNSEPTSGLPRTFCEKCVAKIKLSSSFKKSSLTSENYLKSFFVKINQEYNKSFLQHLDNDDSDIDQLLFDEKQEQEQEDFNVQEALPAEPAEIKPSIKKSPEKPAEKSQTVVKKTEKIKHQQIKLEKLGESKSTVTDSECSDKEGKVYMDMESSALYEEEEQLDDDGNIFGEEIYDIMEIENEGGDNIYLDESGKQVLGDEESEFILVNFKSSNEDLTEKDQQFVVEELYDDDTGENKAAPSRKKHVNRMPREIIEKYAQSTEDNQHICTKCVKVFSTRTNLIRHIQSHDGYKAYVCQICQKGFTQSGSLKQHMYIHSGERPYRCTYCDRAFTQGKTLKFHLRRHTEEKPFQCNQCNATFRQRDGLKRHLKSRHNIELKFERNNTLNEKMVGFVNLDQEPENAEKSLDKSSESIEMSDESKKA